MSLGGKSKKEHRSTVLNSDVPFENPIATDKLVSVLQYRRITPNPLPFAPTTTRYLDFVDAEPLCSPIERLKIDMNLPIVNFGCRLVMDNVIEEAPSSLGVDQEPERE